MALWLWLERVVKGFNPASLSLLALPNPLLVVLANESVLAIQCTESREFPYPLDNIPDIPLIQSVTKTQLNMKFFHDHRLQVINGVAMLYNDVCIRAFKDIFEEKMKKIVEEHADCGQEEAKLPFWGVSTLVMEEGGSSLSNVDEEDEKKNLNPELEEVLGSLKLKEEENIKEEKAEEVAPEERSIFLKFSRGFPISEIEVQQFFTEKFGDIVENVYMQEVKENKQPLHARLVVNSASNTESVLERRTKVKFTINGKHVWASKFVQKNKSNANSSSSST
ncbi:hypothetical protein UlMin_024615 [Ulmus minor]